MTMVHLDNEILVNTKKKPIQLELLVAVSHPTWALVPHTGPLQEQFMLLTAYTSL